MHIPFKPSYLLYLKDVLSWTVSQFTGTHFGLAFLSGCLVVLFCFVLTTPFTSLKQKQAWKCHRFTVNGGNSLVGWTDFTSLIKGAQHILKNMICMKNMYDTSKIAVCGTWNCCPNSSRAEQWRVVLLWCSKKFI